MIKFALTEKEEKQPQVLWTGQKCQCGCKTFTITSGGSECCLWVKFHCTKCGKIEEWDLSTGEC